MNKWKRLKGLIYFGITLILILTVFILVKNIALVQIKHRIHSSINYTQLFFSTFPPSLIIEEAESYTLNPYFSARKISVRLSLKSIISRGKPLNIIIEDPELRISKRDTEQPSLGKKGGDFTIPVFIESLFLRNGKFSYETSGLRLHSEGINAVFSQNQNNFTLYSKIKKNDLFLKEFERKIQGNLYLALTGRGKK
ncbi:MAG TPA: hypothetical protein VFG01_03575, partial [Acidobacteriota bacterium]|nr:hypothetical protein [Acidobacteriota bacterium]